MSNTASFTRFPELPTELRLMVWESTAPTHARGLLVLYRTGGGVGNLALVAYAMSNWDFSPQFPFGVGLAANAEGRASELATFDTVDMVGDLVRAWLPGWSVRQPARVNFGRDMVYLALQSLHYGSLGAVNFRLLLALGRVAWGNRVQSLALLVGDAPWNYWGGELTDGEIRQTVRRLQGLQRFWVVLSLAPFWPPGFDHGLRVEHGFMPVDLGHHVPHWAWFGGEYVAFYSLLLDRIVRIAGEEGRQDLEVTLVFDVNHDGDWWFNHDLYRRFVNTW